MLRLAFLLAFPVPLWAAAESAPATAEPVPPPRPIVWFAHSADALDFYTERPSVSGRMADALVMAATGTGDVASAWKKLVAPADRVGIKVSAVGGTQFSTHVGIVEAILDGLEKAGLDRRKVIVWDRSSEDLKAAGFDARKLRCQVRGIDPPAGWDRAAAFQAPALGRLIWGDLLFAEKSMKKLGRSPLESDQLSSTSHLAAILTKDVTRIINVPVLSTESSIGVAGAFFNVTVPNVDNWRRFVTPAGGAIDSIPELYLDENIAPKIALHLMDGLAAQYANGPDGNPNYAFPHATIYASRDPVALDSTAVRKLDEWRRETRLPPIAGRARWLAAAAGLGLGTFDPAKIELRQVSPP